jgi:hypothetical protein
MHLSFAYSIFSGIRQPIYEKTADFFVQRRTFEHLISFSGHSGMVQAGIQ